MKTKKQIIDGLEMMQSFCIAMQSAGGSCNIDLKNKTAFDLLTMLATNNIRFIYKEETKK